MSRLTTTYTGRALDLGIVVPFRDGQGAALGFTNTVVTGIAKLAQRIIVLLLTGLDTKLFDALGVALPNVLLANNNLNQGTLYHVTQLAISDVLALLAEEPTTADDETVAQLTLTELSCVNGTVNIYLDLVTTAGTTTPIVVPVAYPLGI